MCSIVFEYIQITYNNYFSVDRVKVLKKKKAHNYIILSINF